MLHRPDHSLLAHELGEGALAERPHLFSDAQVVLPKATYEQITGFVSAVSALVARPSYQAAVAVRQGASIVPMPSGVCLAFDFHVGSAAPQLIEINTNAGGALLVTLLTRAWGNDDAADLAEVTLLEMFATDWSAWQSGRP